MRLLRHPLRRCFLLHLAIAFAVGLFSLGARAGVSAETLRVAVIGNSPPMSYEDGSGKLVGFNIELAEAVCSDLAVRCAFHRMPIGNVIDALSAGDIDFAAVSFLVTPERRERVAVSKLVYRSSSVWMGLPSLNPGRPDVTVAAVKGSVQAGYAEQQGWKTRLAQSHLDLPGLVASGEANAMLVPTATSVLLLQNETVAKLGLKFFVIADPSISGEVAIAINPRRKDLQPRIDAAIDRIKADGRFDRINSKYLPFRLQ